MPAISQKYEMDAKPEEVWDALVNSETIEIWSKDEAKMKAEVGAEWMLWGGQMFGTNLEVEPLKKLVQAWCYEEWDKDKPSKVTITLKQKGRKTIVELLHEDVPEKSLKSITEGWNTYYLGAIKEMFEEINLKKKK
jgi:activator of HSP90 ATPase